MNNYIQVTEKLGRKFYEDFQNKGKIVMLNLLKFKAVADYSKHTGIAPKKTITGEQAYRLYMKDSLPEIEKANSHVLFYGKCNHFLIGPESER